MALLRDSGFLPTIFPALYAEGIGEGSLHAYMLSAYVLVGERLGFTPVSDAPVFDRLGMLLMGGGAKRPDAVWMERSRSEIRCLVEFERYTPQSLTPKAKNLLIMGKDLQPPPHLVVLNYWAYAPVASDALRETQALFAHGFTYVTGMRVPQLSCPALALETIVGRQGAETSVRAITPRLFVHGGEDKPYIVRRLDSL